MAEVDGRSRLVRKSFFGGLLGLGVRVQNLVCQAFAREWNEDWLSVVRLDFPAQNVHARNLFYLSAAMYDVWAAYDDAAVGVFHHEVANAPFVVDSPPEEALKVAREEAISYGGFGCRHNELLERSISRIQGRF